MKVAVTGLNNVDNPGPGVPVIRGIKESEEFDGEIVGLMYDALEPGAYMPEVTKSNYLIPYPSGGLDVFFERLSQINEIEKIDVIIPTLDAELFAFAKLKPKLESIGIKTLVPTIDQLTIRGKDQLFNFCERYNITAPKNYLASSVQDLYRLPSELKYPVAVKGIFYDAYIANNFDEAETYFKKISSKWGYPIIVQEYIRGSEYNVCALGDGEGDTVGAVAMKKLFITDKGKAWAGVSIEDNEIIDISKKIIKELNWLGGAEFEFMRDEETNKNYLLEINPRFPAWVYLAVASGQNLPYAAAQLALGKNVKPFNTYETGKIFLRYSWDLITDMKQFEEITVKGVLKNG